MTKVLRCSELNPGCKFEARGDSEAEVLRAAAEHAKAKHGMNNIPPEVMSKVRSLVRDEGTGSKKAKN